MTNKRTLSTAETQPENGLPGVARVRPMILVVLLTVQITAILALPMPPGQLAAALAAVTTLAVLQVRHFRGTARRSRWLTPGFLAAEGLATYLPLLAMGAVWPGMGGLFAASLLLVVCGPAGWALFAAVIASLFAAAMALHLGVYDASNAAVASAADALIIFGAFRLASVLRHAQGARTEAAQLAVVRERVRFARDLHDLLSYSLTAITLRAELTRRLVSSDPATASDELRDVVDIARHAVAEVRQVADGYRNLSLAHEVAGAASLLASADIAAHVDMNCGVLPDKVDNVLAMVLRELITNVLRHSSAQNCWITVEQGDDQVTMSLANDGVPRATATHRAGGGLENLASRLEIIDGALNATVRGDRRFCVCVEIAIKADELVGARHQRT
ncbi:histidine kinase [Dactylosporangium sp. NPDC005555]|uniref:sensor histidine kinase n=1 Tax=Dactylosporangium sp. NPDC005555 TaxID=3154889 RepID=UPI0033BDDE59